MTAFDALMPGAPDASLTGRRAGGGGGAGDWRQAVEQAQAKSWLGNRNVDTRRGSLPTGEVSSAGVAVPASPRAASLFETEFPSLTERRSDAIAGQSREDAQASPQSGTQMSQAQRSITPSVGIVSRVVPSAFLNAHAVEPLMTTAALAFAPGVRPRKQSLHVETGEQGVSVWLRDTALNSQQANHLAAAIVANIEGGGRSLAALYLNGRALVGDSAIGSSFLSSPNPSE